MATYRMLEYIQEQPAAIERTLSTIGGQIDAAIELVRKRSCRRLVVAGFGSSYTAALMAKPAFLTHCGLPVEIVVATDLVTLSGLALDAETAVVLVSRSGERGWIIRALEEVQRRRCASIALTASPTSKLAQGAERVILTAEGPESAFAKTKSVVTTAVALVRFALGLAKVDSLSVRTCLNELRALPAHMASFLPRLEAEVQSLGPWIAGHDYAMVTGVDGEVGTALETAIKIQESASIVAYPDHSGNALHGALGVLSSRWLCIAFVSVGNEKLSASLLQLVGEFGAHRLCVAARGTEGRLVVEKTIVVPRAANPLLQPLLSLPAGQLLSFVWAVQRNLNPDAPAFASTMLKAMLEPGRAEPDWQPAA
jgi:glucosamine 6-phosphate synthetase-like amidotransferase/phosphosugar isomerase protein